MTSISYFAAWKFPVKVGLDVLEWTLTKRSNLTPEELAHVEWMENNPSDAMRYTQDWL